MKQEYNYDIIDALLGEAGTDAVSAEAVPNGEEVREITMSTVDWKTDTPVEAVYYYWSAHPELSQIIVTVAQPRGLTVQNIQVKSAETVQTDTLSENDWSQDEYGLIHLSPEYLAGLIPDVTYTMVVDFGSLRLSFKVCSVEDLNKVVYGEASLVPGFIEYLRTEPGDVHVGVANSFGRKLLKLQNIETGEELDSSYYDYDEQNQMVCFHQNLFGLSDFFRARKRRPPVRNSFVSLLPARLR